MFADLKRPHMVGWSSTMPGRGACPLLEDGTGLGRRGYRGRELQGLETARMCLLCSLRGRGHILSDTESEGATPCSAAVSLRWGAADAEAGPAIGPQQGQGAHHATQTRLAELWMN